MNNLKKENFTNILYEKLKKFKQGDIILVELSGVGSEQSGTRPVIVLQNNIGNIYSPTIIVAPISTIYKALPTHYTIENWRKKGLLHKSYIYFEQITTIDKCRVKREKIIGNINMNNIILPLLIAFGLEKLNPSN